MLVRAELSGNVVAAVPTGRDPIAAVAAVLLRADLRADAVAAQLVGRTAWRAGAPAAERLVGERVDAHPVAGDLAPIRAAARARLRILDHPDGRAGRADRLAHARDRVDPVSRCARIAAAPVAV